MSGVNVLETRAHRARRRPAPARRALALAAVAVLVACSSESKDATLTVTPSEWTVAAGGESKEFIATLSHSSAPVEWSIETAGSAAEVGGVASGFYTPPPALSAARDVIVRASAGPLVARALVHVLANTVVDPELPPPPEPVIPTAMPLAIDVVDATTGLPIGGGFRWLIEENAMKLARPGEVAIAYDSPSLSLHPSYMPVVASGTEAGTTNPPNTPTPVTLDPAKRYFVSALPNEGYQMGGAAITGGDATVRIRVQRQNIPTAQISIFAFEDNAPINNAPDLPEERGLGGFMVLLAEGGGTYGASGGPVTQDAFGNPIGTEYQQNADGTFVLGPDGAPVVASRGTGFVFTDTNGMAVVKYLPPAKYGVQLDPPQGSSWQQVTTIEGTKTIDAWIQANEPQFMQEFGPPTQHVFMGFVQPFRDASVLNGTSTITGRIVNLHFSRPPQLTAHPGDPIDGCWVGLNDLGGTGRGVFAGPCGEGGTFSIPNAAPGLYQLVVWDEFLDLIIGFYSVPVTDGDVELGDVTVNRWFAAIEGRICFDADENGFCTPDDPGTTDVDESEAGIQDQLVNLRFRDGSVYQSTGTDIGTGAYAFTEIFPFFNWFVAEVDFARYRATGATVVVDDGGPIPAGASWEARGKLTPQPQAEVNPITGNALSRTETGAVLTQGYQAFAGLTNVIDWGKWTYAGNENGGVSGIVHYASTRAEDDPRFAAADNWEPKIPRVPVVLYRDCDGDGRIDAPDCSALSSAGYQGVLADVDHWPFGWSEGGAKGFEDVKRSTRGAALFDRGDAYDLAVTDSWDDAPPTGCRHNQLTGPYRAPDAGGQLVDMDCFEGLPNFNQVRPAVFDGGYAFMSDPANPDLPLPAGVYVVEAVTPPGYEHVKEEDRNVDFGDAYVPSPLLLAPPCVGPRRVVPDELTLFPGVPTAAAGQITHLCDRKQIEVKPGQNAAVDFFMFTTVPATAHIVQLVTDDLNNATNTASPSFGEKLAMGSIPVAIHDWAGVELVRSYTDQWGVAQYLVPSTFTANAAMPSGYAPNMLRVCVNSPGRFDAAGTWIPDPFHDPTHSHTCYSFQFMPGKTTYLDTPVIPVAAFSSRQTAPVDCTVEDGTPVIASVEGSAGGVSQGGPLVPTAGGTVVLTSAGFRSVPNPAWDGVNGVPTVLRNYGFGDAQGAVTLGGAQLDVVSWTNGAIEATVPAGAQTGQLEVERADGTAGAIGVTLTVEDPAVTPIVVAPGGSIQAAIDAAQAGQLILVRPGTYKEMLIVHKPVRLQGWGAPSTTIWGIKTIAGTELPAWRAKLAALATAGEFDLLPGQVPGATLFAFEEGPAVLVAGNAGEFAGASARIDGFTVTGASEGGGILVSGHAGGLRITNNDVTGNAGAYGGGIRVGHPALVDANGDYVDADNDGVVIARNRVAMNGGTAGVAGGIAMCTGADAYAVRDNFVCGNFSNGHGGGISHVGLSAGGVIDANTIRFNQAYLQGQISEGGGIFVGGQPAVGGGLSPGTGSVTINGNLLQGNHAATGDGGGIRLQFVNGLDVAAAPANPAAWYRATVEGNLVVNNVAGNAGGGISLQDVVLARIVGNTIANNDSTGTSIAAFAAGAPNQSASQPAGVVSWAHSTALAGAIAAPAFAGGFSNPELTTNIVWHNRSFFWTIDVAALTQGLVPDIGAGGTPVYRDLGVLGMLASVQLDPRSCVLTDTTGYDATNTSTDPGFAREYVNGDRVLSVTTPDVPSSMTTFAAFDEGGNFLSLEYGPLTPNRLDGLPYGVYHLP